MKKLEKAIKIPIIVFALGVIFILVADWRDIGMGEQVTNMFMIIFFISLCSVLGIGLILSIKAISKYIKRDSMGFIRSVILRFIIIFVIDIGIDYMKGREIDLVYGLSYSILLTIGSFYLQERFSDE